MDLYKESAVMEWHSVFSANKYGAFCDDHKITDDFLVAKSERGWLYQIFDGEAPDENVILLCRIGDQYAVKKYPMIPDNSGAILADKDQRQIVTRLNPDYSVVIIPGYQYYQAMLKANGLGTKIDLSPIPVHERWLYLNEVFANFTPNGYWIREALNFLDPKQIFAGCSLNVKSDDESN